MTDVVVFGAGSLGSLIGGLLARTRDVTLVGRTPHVERVREAGLRISGAVDDRVFPDAVTDARGLDAELAVVTVKSFDTAEAAETLATGSFDAALSLQNGLTEETLADRLEPATTVLAGTATYGARLLDPGHVECTGVGSVVLGARRGGTDPLAERAGKAFRDAGVETLVATDMPRRRFEKLAVNAGINAVTALARVENGVLGDGPGECLARDAARETARIARAGDVPLSDRRAVASLEEVVDATAANHSSMLQDVAADRRTEIDAINGEVVARARTHDLSVPVNRTLTALVRTWERARSLR